MPDVDNDVGLSDNRESQTTVLSDVPLAVDSEGDGEGEVEELMKEADEFNSQLVSGDDDEEEGASDHSSDSVSDSGSGSDSDVKRSYQLRSVRYVKLFFL